jgi:hemerythrin-like metal-binding protein
MALIIWDGKLEIGHALIDQQHRSLVDAFNRLHLAMMQGKGKQDLEGILTFLQDYISFHFEIEENLMKECHYSKLATHRELHSIFGARVQHAVTQFRNDPSLMTLPVINLLNDYLLDYLREDLHFGDEMRRMGFLSPPNSPVDRSGP